MELFTFGVGHYTEADVYAGARVFTGWNTTTVDRGLPGQQARGRRWFVLLPPQRRLGRLSDLGSRPFRATQPATLRCRPR